MTTLALNGLWAYIQTLNLSKRNKKWLADKLIAHEEVMDETTYINSSSAMQDIIEKGRAEIDAGKGESVNVDDLWK